MTEFLTAVRGRGRPPDPSSESGIARRTGISRTTMRRNLEHVAAIERHPELEELSQRRALATARRLQNRGKKPADKADRKGAVEMKTDPEKQQTPVRLMNIEQAVAATNLDRAAIAALEERHGLEPVGYHRPPGETHDNKLFRADDVTRAYRAMLAAMKAKGKGDEDAA